MLSLRVAAVALLVAVSPLHAQQRPADIILTNGRVITVDASDRVVQAVAIGGGRILAVGSNGEVLKLAGPSTQRIDLHGRAVTPGLLDAHAHFSTGAAARAVLDLSYPAGASVHAVRDSVSARARGLAAGAWVLGHGWDEGKLAEKRLLTRRDLDDVAGDHPAWLEHTTGHYGVANSKALALAGITKDTKDPPSGTIDRFPDGTPTGVLKEAAQSLVIKFIPPPSPASVEAGMAALAKDFNAEGMTGLKDPGIDETTWQAYANTLKRGQLTVRVFALWQGGNTIESVQRVIDRHAATSRPYESTGDDRLIAGGVKLYMDGSGGARTAWLWKDWNKNRSEIDSGNVGYPAADPAVVRRQIDMLHDAGMHTSVHSIGDRAIDWVVDSYDAAYKRKPTRSLRDGVIHANIPTDHALEVIARLQRDYDAAVPEPSATFMWWIGDTYAGNFGAERSMRLNPFHTFLSRGIRWANGSDYVVTPFAARYGIWAAVAREPLLGTWGKAPFGTAESVDVHTALKAVTIWAAHQLFLEKKIGSIEVGKYADLAVWDRDPYSVDVARLKDMRCDLTILDGRVVFDRRSDLLSRKSGE